AFQCIPPALPAALQGQVQHFLPHEPPPTLHTSPDPRTTHTLRLCQGEPSSRKVSLQRIPVTQLARPWVRRRIRRHPSSRACRSASFPPIQGAPFLPRPFVRAPGQQPPWPDLCPYDRCVARSR